MSSGSRQSESGGLSFYWMMDAMAPGDGESGVLQESAREETLLAKQLPHRNPDRMWGGPSSGGGCAVCARLIGRGELELEIEFDRNGGTSEPDRYRIHVRCLSAVPGLGAPGEGP